MKRILISLVILLFTGILVSDAMPAQLGDVIVMKEGILGKVIAKKSSTRYQVSVYADPDNNPTGELVIPYFTQYGDDVFEVYEVEKNGFQQCDITSLHLPNSLKYINEKSFYGCTHLNRVTSAENPILNYIGDYAFAHCFALESVEFPSVQFIGQFAFLNSGLVTADFPVVFNIGAGAFQECKKLERISPSSNLENIGNIAFCNSPLLQGIWLGPNVENIGSNAFAFNTTMPDVVIPRMLESVGNAVFSGCALESIYVCTPDFVELEPGLDLIKRQSLRKIYCLPETVEPIKNLVASQEKTPFYDPANIEVLSLNELVKPIIVELRDDKIYFKLEPQSDDISNIKVWNQTTHQACYELNGVYSTPDVYLQISWDKGEFNHLNYLIELDTTSSSVKQESLTAEFDGKKGVYTLEGIYLGELGSIDLAKGVYVIRDTYGSRKVTL